MFAVFCFTYIILGALQLFGAGGGTLLSKLVLLFQGNTSVPVAHERLC